MLVLAIEFSKNDGIAPLCRFPMEEQHVVLHRKRSSGFPVEQEPTSVALSKRNRDSQAFGCSKYEDKSYKYEASAPAN